jgi:hypothetical protein
MSYSNEGDAFKKLLGLLWGDGTPINVTESILALGASVADL